MSAQEKFNDAVQGSNFMTPHIIKYYTIPNGAIELSQGEFLDLTLFGVTVVLDNKLNHELSKSFYSLVDALNYITKFTRS